jgi:DNA-directed RNA polymerase subunit RPC12/RpoP
MAIDTICQSCGKNLRVADEHAGQQARCPNCQSLYTVPPRSAVIHLALAAPGEYPDRWQMKTPEGLVYGPVTKQELDQWCRQGRITPRCQLLQERRENWLWGGEVYPELQQAAATMMPAQITSVTPYAPMPIPPGSVYYPKAHRGMLILVLALLGYGSACFIVSVVAFILGLQDLAEMKSGRMDPEGRTMTLVGMVLAGLWVAGNVGLIGLAFVGVFW